MDSESETQFLMVIKQVLYWQPSCQALIIFLLSVFDAELWALWVQTLGVLNTVHGSHPTLESGHGKSSVGLVVGFWMDDFCQWDALKQVLRTKSNSGGLPAAVTSTKLASREGTVATGTYIPLPLCRWHLEDKGSSGQQQYIRSQQIAGLWITTAEVDSNPELCSNPPAAPLLQLFH